MEKECKFCKNVFKKSKTISLKEWENTRLYCSMSCKAKDRKPFRLGVAVSEGTRAKMSKSFKGRIPWNKGKQGLVVAWNKGKICPQLSGDKHWNWQGGISTIYHIVRNCFKYKEWRKSVFERDNYTCQECGCNESGFLNADHIIPFATILHRNNIKSENDAVDCFELWNLDNGRTLCVDCHKKTPTYSLKLICQMTQ